MTQGERRWQPVRLSSDMPAPAGAYSPAAPAGAYSPAARAGDFIFVSGQVPRDPTTGNIAGADVESQTRQVIKNIERALASTGASLSDVVSVTVYLADVDDWGKFNAVYKDIMPQPYPTRTALGASLRGILVEMSAIAYVGEPRAGSR